MTTLRSVFHPVLDLLFLADQRPPGLPVAVGAVRTDPLHHLADQLVGELVLAAVALHAELDGRCDVAPSRLAVDADPLGAGRSPSPRNHRRSASWIWTTVTSLNAMGPPPYRLRWPSRMSPAGGGGSLRVVP